MNIQARGARSRSPSARPVDIRHDRLINLLQYKAIRALQWSTISMENPMGVTVPLPAAFAAVSLPAAGVTITAGGAAEGLRFNQ